jgi:CheY-like chemotaxis protein
VTPAPAVLLAADDRDTREFLAGALRDLGYPVTVVADGADAWTAYEEAQRIAEVVKRIGARRNPMSVEYLPGTTMIDLGTTGGELREAPPSARTRSQ